jgi:putative ATP-dependent endonuclease of OLD family
VFVDLSLDDEADFAQALKLGADGKTEAHLGVTYGNSDKAGRLQVRRWCGDHEDLLMTTGMLENLRSVYSAFRSRNTFVDMIDEVVSRG